MRLLILILSLTLAQISPGMDLCRDVVQPSDKIRHYKTLIESLDQTSTRWSCRSGLCLSLSQQLATALQSMGMPAERAGVSSIYPQQDPLLPKYGGFHFFVIDRCNPHTEIIIDSTYKQFFIKNIPESEIFVGTREDLIQIFTRYKKLIRLQDGGDPKYLDPAGIVETYYGFGRAELNKFNRPSRVKP